MTGDELDIFDGKPVVVDVADVQLTSDAGLLPIRQLDEVWGLTEQFAGALGDTRRRVSVEHSFLQMVCSRVYGILADYPDQNDHDTLRSDPAFKLIADRPSVPGKRDERFKELLVQDHAASTIPATTAQDPKMISLLGH